MKILISFTHLHVISNVHDLLSSAEHKIRYFVGNQTTLAPIDVHRIDIKSPRQFLKYLLLWKNNMTIYDDKKNIIIYQKQSKHQYLA